MGQNLYGFGTGPVYPSEPKFNSRSELVYESGPKIDSQSGFFTCQNLQIIG